MDSVISGQEIWLEGNFVDVSGLLTDPSSISLFILSDTTVIAGPFTYPGDVTQLGTGRFEYRWIVPAGTPAATYTAKWTSVTSGVSAVAYEDFLVTSEHPSVSGVASSDVFRLTNIAVTDAQVANALGVIELYASVNLSNFAAFGARDRKWLQAAVCYQAAWMDTQPDYMGRSDFMNMSQDGLSLSTRDQNTLALAPLARKALSRVSWVRPRTVRVSPGVHSRVGGYGGATYPVGSPITEAMVGG